LSLPNADKLLLFKDWYKNHIPVSKFCKFFFVYN
jgi:hypothetical protein